MKILIVGASGLVGGNCLNYLSNNSDYSVLGTHFSYPTNETVYFNTLDIDDSKNKNVLDFKPKVIIHCGALSHVDYCEDNIDESYNQTVKSTKNIIDFAKQTNSKIVYISTDYIFDGKNGPYSETDDTNPISIYGKHKLEAEKSVLATSTHNVSIRVTNIYGNEVRNKNFVCRLAETSIEQKEITIKLASDQYATPINALDIARAIELLIANNKIGIYGLSTTEYYNRVELAEKVLAKFPQHKIAIESCLTADLNQKAKRPLNGGLKNDKFLHEFPGFKFSTVDDYLNTLVE